MSKKKRKIKGTKKHSANFDQRKTPVEDKTQRKLVASMVGELFPEELERNPNVTARVREVYADLVNNGSVAVAERLKNTLLGTNGERVKDFPIICDEDVVLADAIDGDHNGIWYSMNN